MCVRTSCDRKGGRLRSIFETAFCQLKVAAGGFKVLLKWSIITRRETATSLRIPINSDGTIECRRITDPKFARPQEAAARELSSSPGSEGNPLRNSVAVPFRCGISRLHLEEPPSQPISVSQDIIRPIGVRRREEGGTAARV